MEEWDPMNQLSPDWRRVLIFMIQAFPFAIILLYCIYLRNLSRLLKAIRPQNRRQRPAAVWLLLLGFLSYMTGVLSSYTAVPYTAIIVLAYVIVGGASLWQFYIAFKIAASIRAEFDSRGLPVAHAPTLKWAVNYSLAQLVQIPLSLHYADSIYTLIVWFWVMISWIAYWAKTAQYKKRLFALPVAPDKGSILFGDLY